MKKINAKLFSDSEFKETCDGFSKELAKLGKKYLQEGKTGDLNIEDCYSIAKAQGSGSEKSFGKLCGHSDKIPEKIDSEVEDIFIKFFGE